MAGQRDQADQLESSWAERIEDSAVNLDTLVNDETVDEDDRRVLAVIVSNIRGCVDAMRDACIHSGNASAASVFALKHLESRPVQPGEYALGSPARTLVESRADTAEGKKGTLTNLLERIRRDLRQFIDDETVHDDDRNVCALESEQMQERKREVSSVLHQAGIASFAGSMQLKGLESRDLSSRRRERSTSW